MVETDTVTTRRHSGPTRTKSWVSESCCREPRDVHDRLWLGQRTATRSLHRGCFHSFIRGCSRAS